MTFVVLPEWCRDTTIVSDNCRSPSASFSLQSQQSLNIPALRQIRCPPVTRNKKSHRKTSPSSPSSPPSRPPQPRPRPLKKTCSDSGPQIVGLLPRTSSSEARERRSKSVNLTVEIRRRNDRLNYTPQMPLRKQSIMEDEDLSADIATFKNFVFVDSDSDDEMCCAPPSMPQRKTSLLLTDELECFNMILSSASEECKNSDSSKNSYVDECDRVPSSKQCLSHDLCALPPQAPKRQVSLMTPEDVSSLQSLRHMIDDSDDEDDDEPPLPKLQSLAGYSRCTTV